MFLGPSWQLLLFSNSLWSGTKRTAKDMAKHTIYLCSTNNPWPERLNREQCAWSELSCIALAIVFCAAFAELNIGKASVQDETSIQAAVLTALGSSTIQQMLCCNVVLFHCNNGFISVEMVASPDKLPFAALSRFPNCNLSTLGPVSRGTLYSIACRDLAQYLQCESCCVLSSFAGC